MWIRRTWNSQEPEAEKTHLSNAYPSMTDWMSGVCGINIHYLRTGGCKPPLVLLHGLTGSGACWIPLARGLKGEYDVVMPDARGHGNSSTPLNGYRYEDHASDVVGLIQGLGIAAPVLLGHSMGGMTAAVVASQLATAIQLPRFALSNANTLRSSPYYFQSSAIETGSPGRLVPKSTSGRTAWGNHRLPVGNVNVMTP
jgi:pimeloyl-ACP methyl ester carboxylesterase